ncbi:MAG: nucleotide pyrophosphohydrolase [Candidatus Methanomethylophilaceae archaeon]|nr:nucleotide pyrophosphohydrolase [Candidatus Methanomethylophilaceae archaeon]
MGTDEDTTVSQLEDMVERFCEERDWDRFHGPKDLAIGLATESSELLQIFRFKNDEESKALVDGASREHVREELADSLYFILRFARMNGIDLTGSLRDKLVKNAEHYPVETSRGSNRKYDE